MAIEQFPVRLETIQKAHAAIKDRIIRTPVHTSAAISREVQDAVFPADCQDHERLRLYFKCENLQKAGSFKFRGAYHFLTQLSECQLRAGIISYSTGNHAIGLTMAARSASEARGFHIPVEILMTWTASQSKIDRIRRMGATVTQHGPTLVECQKLAEEIQRDTGATIVPPSGHHNIALGQGTAMLEFHEQMQELNEGRLDAVLVPSAGGALLAGTAVACNGLDPKIKVFGTEPLRGGANLREARETRRRSTQITDHTIADGLRSVTAPCNWEIVREKNMVDSVYSVDDEEIQEALCRVIEDMKLLIEPSSAVPVAALLFNRQLQEELALLHKGKPLKVGVILTGGNINLKTLGELLEKTAESP